jgi:dTMP kinase
VGQPLSTGRFISLEGGEGAGKSTQLRLLQEALDRAGLPVLATREPGGAPGAEEIRKLLVEGPAQRWDAETELLLMLAARRSHLTETVWPALHEGKLVLSDRFSDSTLAYQGYGRGLPRNLLTELHRFIAGKFTPDLTLILDLPVEVGISRALGRAGRETRFERMDWAFHERVRRGFLEIARSEPRRCVVIDASLDLESVRASIRKTVQERLGVAL